jgi:hypothetical protein
MIMQPFFSLVMCVLMSHLLILAKEQPVLRIGSHDLQQETSKSDADIFVFYKTSCKVNY